MLGAREPMAHTFVGAFGDVGHVMYVEMKGTNRQWGGVGAAGYRAGVRAGPLQGASSLLPAVNPTTNLVWLGPVASRALSWRLNGCAAQALAQHGPASAVAILALIACCSRG